DAAEVLVAAVLEAALAAAAGVDLGLEDDWAAEGVELLDGVGRGGDGLAARHGRACPGQQGFCLVFVNLHANSPENVREPADPPTTGLLSERAVSGPIRPGCRGARVSRTAPPRGTGASSATRLPRAGRGPCRTAATLRAFRPRGTVFRTCGQFLLKKCR